MDFGSLTEFEAVDVESKGSCNKTLSLHKFNFAIAIAVAVYIMALQH